MMTDYFLRCSVIRFFPDMFVDLGESKDSVYVLKKIN